MLGEGLEPTRDCSQGILRTGSFPNSTQLVPTVREIVAYTNDFRIGKKWAKSWEIVTRTDPHKTHEQ